MAPDPRFLKPHQLDPKCIAAYYRLGAARLAVAGAALTAGLPASKAAEIVRKFEGAGQAVPNGQ